MNELGKFSTLSVLSVNPEQMSNRELLERCRQLGSVAVTSRRMFIGLLPLMERRGAYDVKKFSSIFHFASVVGGVGYQLVEEVLRLDAQLVDLRLMRRALYSGEIGWSKIRAVLSLVTSNNEEQWLGLLRDLSKPALEVYVRDYRKQQKDTEGTLFSENGTCVLIENVSQSSLLLKSAENEAENFPGEIIRLENQNKISQPAEVVCEPPDDQPVSKLQQLSTQREVFSFPANSALVARLRLFRQKLEKRLKRMITWEDVLEELLERE